MSPNLLRAAQRLQASNATQQSDAQPFAVLLDANAPTTPPPAAATSSTPGTPPPSGQQSAAAANAPTTVANPMRNATANSAPTSNATGVGKPASPGAGSAISKPASNATSKPDATAASAAAPATDADPLPTDTNTATGTDADTNTNNVPTANDPAQQPGSSAATAIDVALAAASVLNVAQANSATAAAVTKAAGKDVDKNGQADSAAATPSTGQAPPSASPQPIAAAIVLNSAAEAVPATAEASSAAEQAKARAKLTLPIAVDEKRVAQDAKDDAAASAPATQSTAAEQTIGDGAASGSAGNATNATPPVAGAQQAQIQADSSAIVLAQSEAIAQASNGRASPHGGILGSTAALGAAGLANAQGASGTANALPNFGLVAANALTAGATSAGAVSPTVSDAAVPLSGLAVAIAARAQTGSGSSQFDIRLDPPELGRIDVRLGVDGNGQVTTHVTVDRPDTLQLLQSQQPQLERALEQAGLKTADNGLQFTLRDQSFAGQNGSGGGAQQNMAQLVIPDAELAPVDTAQIYSRLSLGSGLDIRV